MTTKLSNFTKVEFFWVYWDFRVQAKSGLSCVAPSAAQFSQ